MVFLQEDFYSTLTGIKDPNGKKAKILNEISELVAFNKADVIEALNASGVLTPKNAPVKKVVDDVVANIGSNNKLKLGIAYLITQKNYPENASSNDGEQTATTANGSASVLDSMVKSVNNMIDSVFKAQTQEQDKTQILELTNQKMSSDSSSSNSNGGLIGLGIVAVLVIGLLYIAKNKK